MGGELQCCSFETGYKFLAVDKELEEGGQIIVFKLTTPAEPQSKPAVVREPVVIKPYDQTEAGYTALENYWREVKQAPPEGFDLKEWAQSKRVS